MDATQDAGNGRVSNAIIMTKLEFIAKDIDELKTDVKGLPTRVFKLEEEQSKLRTKSDGWSVLNSVGVFVAGLIAYFKT
jgi:hypothetical protein